MKTTDHNCILLKWWVLILKIAKVSDNKISVCTSHFCNNNKKKLRLLKTQFLKLRVFCTLGSLCDISERGSKEGGLKQEKG